MFKTFHMLPNVPNTYLPAEDPSPPVPKPAPKLQGLIAFILKKVDERREGARLSGGMGDNYARELEIQVECFRAGLNGEVPLAWGTWSKEFLKSQDPEYQMYLKLKEKFEE